MIKNWLLYPAKWWQFWLPQSGPVGGLIFAAVATLLAIVFMTITQVG